MNANKNKLNLNYDKDNDVLYVSMGKPKPSYCEEDLNGVLIRRSFQNNKYSGVTIMDFSKKSKEQLRSSIPFKIDVDELYKPIF